MSWQELARAHLTDEEAALLFDDKYNCLWRNGTDVVRAYNRIHSVFLT